MNYGRGTCAECGRVVMTEDGRARAHAALEGNYDCFGTGEPAAETITIPATPAPVVPVVVPPTPPVPKPVVERSPKPRPLGRSAKKLTPAVDENALRLATLSEELKKGVALKEAVSNVNDYMDEHVARGSIDYERLAECDCPSLRAAVRRMFEATRRDG
jgi:hypothetical protein